MSSADDILFSPIIPSETDRKLRELIKKIMTAPPDDQLATTVANQIVDLFYKNGIRDEKEIVDNVNRIVRELNSQHFSSLVEAHTRLSLRNKRDSDMLRDIQ